MRRGTGDYALPMALKSYPRRPIVRIATANETAPSRWREIVAVSIGALIAGIFSFGVAIWSGTGEDERGQCETAGAVITDDRLNESLNPAERRTILLAAQRRLRECIDE